MHCRFALALVAALVATTSVLAEPPKPAVVVQTQPVARLLVEFREMARQVGGPAEAERLVKQFDNSLKDALGEQGFEGLDLNRPLAAYVVFADDIEDTNLVLVVPTTGEKEFVAFLERMKIKAVAVAGKKGTYKLEFPDANLFPKDSHLVFGAGAWAYLTLNGGEAPDPKNLVPSGDLLDNADQSLASVKVFPGRIPEKLVKNLLDQMDNFANALKGFVGAGGAGQDDVKTMMALLEQGPKLVRRYAETGLKEAAEVGLKWNWDQKTGDTALELTLAAKPGTGLAKELAGISVAPNRFAGMMTKDVAVGALVKFPTQPRELQAIFIAQAEGMPEQLKDLGIPEAFHPALEAYAKGIIRSVKKGDIDYGVAVVGPNKDGKFTAVVGMLFDDASELEQALRKAAKTPEYAKLIEFDAAKIGTTGVHKVLLSGLIPKEIGDVFAKGFGDDAPLYAVFAKDALFLAYGPDAVSALKTAVDAKPAAAPVIDVTVNANRLQKLVAAFDEQAGGLVGKALGTEDKLASLLRVTVEGGQTLKVRGTLNLRYLPRLFLFAAGGEDATQNAKRPAK